MDTIQNAPGQTEDILIQLTSDIVSAYVKNHNVPSENLQTLIRETYAALSAPAGSAAESMAEKQKPVPAVAISKSIDENGEFIICLEDGLKFKSMRGHLTTKYNMTPDEYRQRWGLPADYPMVAPVYAKRRSKLARDMGLGRRSSAA
jgi:predicted transcriptional regulator